ncbi:hypothetical protein KEJ39_04515 [Candidatus Bathyarchaeota archaeon]|nr:hypothetical protein [Candidatus Bathyarchaeota archaeon]
MERRIRVYSRCGELMVEYSFSSLIRRRTMILGDVGSGKTKLTHRLLKEALTSEDPESITVIDIAPGERIYNGRTIGGVIADPEIKLSGVRLLKPGKVNAPRYSARDRDELMRQVEENRVLIEETLDLYLLKATPILFINDLSLYFQSGRCEKAREVMERAETFVANAYHGEALGEDLGTGVSVTERRVLEAFAARADILVHL